MDDKRSVRAENYRIKAGANFSCQGCGRGDQLLAVDVPSEDRSACLCEGCIPDRRTHRPRPGQWDEAARIGDELRQRRRAA